MGVFSYLNIKKPASMIWKALSPSRELGETQGGPGEPGTDISGSQEENLGRIKRGFCSPQVSDRLQLIPGGRSPADQRI